ncbi:hypothetical protein AB2N08_16165 [Massilia aurea]|uniref:hypothetical protein n=1 Tax=Massilia aurea TaxID=373040 RepID=UPI003462ABF1
MWHATSDYPAVRRQPPADRTILVWLQVDTASATSLRQAVIRAGLDAVRFLRIDACPSGGAVRALLCVERDAATALQAQLLQCLPGCQWHEAARREGVGQTRALQRGLHVRPVAAG